MTGIDTGWSVPDALQGDVQPGLAAAEESQSYLSKVPLED